MQQTWKGTSIKVERERKIACVSLSLGELIVTAEFPYDRPGDPPQGSLDAVALTRARVAWDEAARAEVD